MTPEQEAEIVSASIPCTIGGEVRSLPELKWRANDAWIDRVRDTMASLTSVAVDAPEGHKAMFHAELDLIGAYDEQGVLAAALETATAREVHAVYERLLEVAFPLADSVTAMTVAAVVKAIEVVRSALENSASSSSPSGTSPTPKTSSPTAKSSSTSRRRRRASNENSGSA